MKYAILPFMNSPSRRNPPSPRLIAFALIAAWLLVLIFILAAPRAFADGGRWRPLGPEGGEVLALLADPLEAGVVYAGALGGEVFVSRDGGDSWQPAGGGLLASWVYTLARAPIAGAPLYAGTDQGLFRLEAGADAWVPVEGGLPRRAVGHLALDPGDPSRLFVTSTRGRLTGSWSVYRSRDGGTSWTNATGDILSVGALVLLPGPPLTLLAPSHGGILRSTDEGETWAWADAGLPILSTLSQIVQDPADPTLLYGAAFSLGSSGPGVFTSRDGGLSWTAADAGLEGLSRSTKVRLALDTGRPETIYFGTREGIFRSTDGARTWQGIQAPPADRQVLALEVDGDDGTVYAGVSRFGPGGASGVLRSRDGGEGWQGRTAGLQASFVTAVAIEAGGRTLVSTETRGIQAREREAGDWIPATTGIAEAQTGTVTRHPTRPSTLFTVAGNTARNARQAYRSGDFGRTWEALGPPLECCLGEVHGDPEDPALLYLTRNGGLLRSLDGGANWQAIQESICGGFSALSVHPSVPGILLAGCYRDSGLPVSPPIVISETWRSTDFGTTWSLAQDGPEGSAGAFWTFRFDPHRPGTVWAGVELLDTASLLRSDDSGASWQTVDGFPGQGIRSIAVHPRRDHEIVVGTVGQGVLRSSDRGATWQPLNDGLASAAVGALTFEATPRARLWAGTGGGGVFVREPPPRRPCIQAADGLCFQTLPSP